MKQYHFTVERERKGEREGWVGEEEGRVKETPQPPLWLFIALPGG